MHTLITGAVTRVLVGGVGLARRMPPVALVLCVVAAVVLPWLLTSGAAAAMAADGTDRVGQGPAMLDWMGLKDSAGVPVNRFELSIDDGGVNSPDLFLWQLPMHALWGVYWSLASIGIWFMDFALSFVWVDWIYQPLNVVGTELHSIMSRFGIGGSLATISACLVAFTFVRGRTVTAIWDYFMIVAVLCVAASSFANPVEKVLGPGGYIMTAHNWTMEAVSNLAIDTTPGGSSTPVFAQDGGQMPITAVFVDTFIRTPQQIVNFGHELSPQCQGVYTDALKAGPYGGDGDIRDKVGACDAAAKKRGDAPGTGMFNDLLSILPAGLIIIVFAVLLAGAVLYSAFQAGWKAVRANVDLVTGVLPGVFRAALAATIAEVLIAVGMVVLSIFFAAAYVIVVASLMRSHTDWPASKTFVLVDVVMVVGLAVFVRQRSKAKDASAQLQRAMLYRPSSPNTAMAPTGRDPLMRGVMATQAITGVARTLRGSRGGSGGDYYHGGLNISVGLFGQGQNPGGDGAQPMPGGHYYADPNAGRYERGPRALPAGTPRALPGRGSDPRALGPAPTGPAPTGPQPSPSSTLVTRLRRNRTVNALVPLVSTAAQAALAHGSGGTSTVVMAGVRAASTLRTARQTQLREKLANPSTSTSAGTSAASTQTVPGQVVNRATQPSPDQRASAFEMPDRPAARTNPAPESTPPAGRQRSEAAARLAAKLSEQQRLNGRG